MSIKTDDCFSYLQIELRVVRDVFRPILHRKTTAYSTTYCSHNSNGKIFFVIRINVIRFAVLLHPATPIIFRVTALVSWIFTLEAFWSLFRYKSGVNGPRRNQYGFAAEMENERKRKDEKTTHDQVRYLRVKEIVMKFVLEGGRRMAAGHDTF